MADPLQNQTISEYEVSLLSAGEFENVSIPLTDWQRNALLNMTSVGIQCLLYMWFKVQPNLQPGTFHCKPAWDNFYCWPPTAAGETITRPCSEILKHQYPPTVAERIQGQATRVCSENATWLWGSWTNYTECANSVDKIYDIEDDRLRDEVRYILFIGSILSFVCLVSSLFIFYYFKCLRCDRVTVHVHLMIALTLRCVLLVVITEPFIFQREHHYRNVDAVCKMVLSLNLFATVTSILWMFLQGVYLHGKLTTNVFDKGTPFKIYYSVGWGLPLVLVITWAIVMEIEYPVECWRDYSEQPYIWILIAPMIFALVTNLLFLINIMRILLTKIQRTNNSGDAAQFRRAVKATAVLFPLLGINNLLFIYNPGGEYKRTFVILNTVFQSTQGIFVSILYCFVSTDVRDAIRRQYRRFLARRSANSIRRNGHNNRSSKYHNGNYRSGGCTTGITGDQQSQGAFVPPIYFRSKFKCSSETNRNGESKSPSPETIANILPRSETPSPVSNSNPGANDRNNVNSLPNAGGVVLTNSVNNKNKAHSSEKNISRLSLSARNPEVNIPMKEMNLFRASPKCSK